MATDWTQKWIDVTLRRMTAWGFNTIGNWSDARLGAAKRVPYVFTTRGWGIESGPMGVADVYAPDFAQRIDQAAAQQCASRKDDPYLLGYFIGNEPPWPGREPVAADVILAGPASALQKELKAFLAAGDTPERRKAFLVADLREVHRDGLGGDPEARSESSEPGAAVRVVGAAGDREGVASCSTCIASTATRTR